MTPPDPLLVEHPSDAIVVFRLNRPQVRNALNLEVRARLADEITRHAADEKIRCLIVTGSVAVFAAGADIAAKWRRPDRSRSWRATCRNTGAPSWTARSR
jgi:enoyl-CoA hydratase/carnithine racemase